ncbi:MAG: PAS domain S-box protein [Thermodesulfobacteriota bacterium]
MRTDADTSKHPAQKIARPHGVTTGKKNLGPGKRKLELLFEQAPFAMMMLARHGAISHVNTKFKELFGWDRSDAPYSSEWFSGTYPDPDYRSQVEAACAALLQEAGPEGPRAVVLRVSCANGEEKVIRFRMVASRGRQHLVTCEDVTEYIRAEEALRESEEKCRNLYEKSIRVEEIYQSLLESCRDAIAVYDMEGRVRYINGSFTEIFGWTLNEVIGERIDYVPESESQVTQCAINSVVYDGKPNCGFETKRCTKDGRILDVRISASRYHDHQGNPAGMLVIVTDVTDRKRQESALVQSEQQLRLLSSQLLCAQEKERKRVAQELHDGIGQSLTAIKFRLENTLKHTRQPAGSNHGMEIGKILPLIQGAIDEVRRISMDLRPSILDDLGILATIKWFCREFQTTFPEIQVGQDVHVAEDDVPPRLKIVVFRVLQEALNNVGKHSGADRVLVSLQKIDGNIELEIRDNGVGFDSSAAFDGGRFRKGFGLASMRERTESSGGSLVIERTAEPRTLLRATWPADGNGFIPR